MKQTLFLLFFLCIAIQLPAQLNMSLVSQVEYNFTVNDVWGWVDDDGTEYAIVGTTQGTSIVSLADPDNAEELFFIPGQNSLWRDIKTWGDFAYVTTDQGGTTEGLLVIDLSELPNNISSFNWNPNIPGEGTLNTCHNIYIDEFGYAYLAGCNVNNGGMVYVDVFSDPGNPQLTALGPPIYSHDVYVRDNKMYSSEIYNGHFAIYDVSDKENSVLLATQNTPFLFTHNTWLSDDGTVLFTTDELANAPIGAYDISDLNDIQELDQYAPIETLGEGVIPHNVHVWNDWLIISYYTDGGIVVDASNPSNLIEVGNFDTFFSSNAGFDGAWGAYPFLPSGVVLVSDMSSGLYVLDVNYVRACWLEGKVTDANNGSPLFDVSVDIIASQPNLASTDIQGDYQTGLATAGTYDVIFSKPGYITQTIEVNLDNGVLTELDVALETAPVFTGLVVQDSDGNPVPGSDVKILNVNDIEVDVQSDGSFSFAIAPGNYTFLAGAWGYKEKVEDIDLVVGEEVIITLEEGYQDGFALDQGWTVVNNAATGNWERVTPLPSFYDGNVSTPGQDVQSDNGDLCFVTGNGGNGGSNDVDDGVTQLVSPLMDLTTYNEPILSYETFFFNDGGFSAPNDYLEIRITNGVNEWVLETIETSQTDWSGPTEWNLWEIVDLSDQMQLIVTTEDQDDAGHIVEATFDAFEIIEGNPDTPTSVTSIEEKDQLKVAPNPFADDTWITYELPEGTAGNLVLTDATGKVMWQQPLTARSGRIQLNQELAPGVYFLEMTATQSGWNRTQKLVRLK